MSNVNRVFNLFLSYQGNIYQQALAERLVHDSLETVCLRQSEHLHPEK